MREVLCGERVRLCALTSEDGSVLYEWVNDRALVILSAPFAPVHEPDHRVWFDKIRARPDVVIFGIRDKPSNELVGSCQLVEIDRRHGYAELQIRIGVPDARGKGIGTEAVGLLLGHAFRDIGLHRVQLHVFASNVAAIRAYEKAGFRREGLLREAAFIDGLHLDVAVMGVLGAEWNAGTRA